jgi:hypothetical protein
MIRQGGMGFVLALALTTGPAANDARPEEGYTPLFNGKDLTGWTYGGKKLDGQTETPDKRFRVAGGAIVANEGSGIKKLLTEKAFNKDFTLKLEFRAGPKADSGVYVRGPQLQVRDYARRGEQKQLKHFQDDGWNELEVAVQGGVATCTCNGEPLAVTGGKPVMKVPDMAREGIGLQAETGKFEYRRIRIKVAE